MEEVRLDRWLCAARIFKSRTLANEACAGGRVKLNDARAKPRHPLRVGDRVHVQTEVQLRILEVMALADRRQSPPKARELYADHSPPPPPREEIFLHRPRGSGRPTKRDRRLQQRLRGRE